MNNFNEIKKSLRYLPVLMILAVSGVMAHGSQSGDKRPLPQIYKQGQAINYSPFRARGPLFGETVNDIDILQDLKLLNDTGYNFLRIFSASEQIIALAAEHYPNMRFQMGLALGGSELNSSCQGYQNNNNLVEIQTGIYLANTYPNISAVSVGNETQLGLVGGPFPGEIINPMPVNCLAGYIQQVRTAIQQPVTTDQIISFFLENVGGDPTDILNAIDFVSYHQYPSFDAAVGLWDWRQANIPAKKRAKAMMQASLRDMQDGYRLLANHRYIDLNGRSVQIRATLPIVMGETGWVSYQTQRVNTFYIPDLEEFIKYTANEVNQKWYFDLLDKWIKSQRKSSPVNYFAFSGMDEYWKNDGAVFPPVIFGNTDGSDAGWGLWDVVRAPNYALCGKPSIAPCNKNVYAGAGYFGKVLVANPDVKVSTNVRWRGFLSGPGFGLVFPIALLRAEFASPEPGQGKLVLRQIFDTPENTGFTQFTSAFYNEDKGLLPGQTVHFSGQCLSDTLPTEYAAEAFIVYFRNGNFGDAVRQAIDLRQACANGGDFTVTLATEPLSIVQYGFTLTGLASVDDLGSIVIQVENDGFPEGESADDDDDD